MPRLTEKFGVLNPARWPKLDQVALNHPTTLKIIKPDDKTKSGDASGFDGVLEPKVIDLAAERIQLNRMVNSTSDAARNAGAALGAVMSRLEMQGTDKTLDLAQLGKARARLEQTVKGVDALAGFLGKHPVELSDSLVRLSSTIQWIDKNEDRLHAKSDDVWASKVKGSPNAVKDELRQIRSLVQRLLDKRDAVLDARTTVPPGEHSWEPTATDHNTALITHPVEADPFQVYRLPNLSPKERVIEKEFADAFKTSGRRMVRDFLQQVRAGTFGAPNVIEPDSAKNLSPRFSRPDLTDRDNPAVKAEIAKSRAESNLPLHMTATVIARLALIQALDDLARDTSIAPDKKTLLVTCGGVAAGKGYAVNNAGGAVGDLAKMVSLVYDTDGETSGTFNKFVLDACKERGIHPIFLYVHADPKLAWERVFSRAEQVGRMVSEEPFLDSHVDSPKNFAAFQAAHKDDAKSDGSPLATFIVIDNSKAGQPRVVDQVPAEALTQDRDQLRDVIKQKTREAQVPTFFTKVAQAGERIWPHRGADRGGPPS